MTKDLVSVPFHGNTLFLVEQNNEPYTPMKPIVEGMGLDWASQFTKLKSDPKRWGSIVITTIQVPGDTQGRETLCIPLRKLPGWLMTIQPSRVKPEIREKILCYQNECDDVLWEYWTKGRAENPRLSSVPHAPSDLEHPHVELERERLRLEAMRLRIERAMKLRRMILDFREREIFGLAEARRAALSAVEILVAEDPSGGTGTAPAPVVDPVLFASLRLAVCAGLLNPSGLITPGGDERMDSFLLGLGIPPTSRNKELCLRISREVMNINFDIRDRILEEELRDPPFRETLEKAVRQYLGEESP